MSVQKILFAALGAAGLLSPLQSFAHVSLEQPSAVAGSTYKAVLRVPHGCEGMPTTSITVFLPAGLVGAKPMPKAGWKLETVIEKLDSAYESHGAKIGERVARITWSGGRLLDAEYDEFVFRGTLPSEPGKRWFRILQVCEKGVSDWAGIPLEGQARPDLPAAGLDITPAITPTRAAAGHVHH